jgi:iron complex transport system substrate-binding protein
MPGASARFTWASMRGFSALLALWLSAGAALAEPPKRVVSLNLCTDQLAMLVAAPGQLVAVTRLAADPMSSAMAEEAKAYPATWGLAEEVFLLKPDLVLAGTYTTRPTVELLRRLGIPVVELPPPSSLADVALQLREVGSALGREAEAEALTLAFEADLDALRAEAAGPRAALYYAGGYAGGDRTLAGEILRVAGFANIAAEAGLSEGGHLPLEILVRLAPDLVVTGQTYPANSRAEEIFAHPALSHLRREGAVSDADWVCGTPHVLAAIGRLGALRERVAE